MSKGDSLNFDKRAQAYFSRTKVEPQTYKGDIETCYSIACQEQLDLDRNEYMPCLYILDEVVNNLCNLIIEQKGNSHLHNLYAALSLRKEANEAINSIPYMLRKLPNGAFLKIDAKESIVENTDRLIRHSSVNYKDRALIINFKNNNNSPKEVSLFNEERIPEGVLVTYPSVSSSFHMYMIKECLRSKTYELSRLFVKSNCGDFKDDDIFKIKLSNFDIFGGMSGVQFPLRLAANQEDKDFVFYNENKGFHIDHSTTLSVTLPENSSYTMSIYLKI